MKGSFLRRNGSFGGRSKITQDPHQQSFGRAIVMPLRSSRSIKKKSLLWREVTQCSTVEKESCQGEEFFYGMRQQWRARRVYERKSKRCAV